jgi:hypothetical protein
MASNPTAATSSRLSNVFKVQHCTDRQVAVHVAPAVERKAVAVSCPVLDLWRLGCAVARFVEMLARALDSHKQQLQRAHHTAKHGSTSHPKRFGNPSIIVNNSIQPDRQLSMTSRLKQHG